MRTFRIGMEIIRTSVALSILGLQIVILVEVVL
jgi:hypothetical protein